MSLMVQNSTGQGEEEKQGKNMEDVFKVVEI